MAANSALDSVLDQATKAADAYVPAATPGTAITQTSPTQGALAKPSMASFADAGGMSVDVYLRPAEAGFQIGDETKKFIDDFEAELDMTEVVPIYSARGEAGGNTKFIKSYDGISTPNGQNFQQALAHLEATTKCSGVYQTAEIPVVLTDDVTFPDKVVIKAGTRVGITPSVTGFKEFQNFVRQLTKQGKEESNVRVKIKHLLRTNRNNNKWGVAQFELLD